MVVVVDEDRAGAKIVDDEDDHFGRGTHIFDRFFFKSEAADLSTINFGQF